MKKIRTIVGVALLAVAAVLAYFHFYGKAKIDEEIKKALASLPEGWAVEYKSIDYALSSDLLSIEGLRITTPSEPPLTIAAEKIEAEGVSLATISDLINGVDNAKDYRPLAKSLTAGTFTLDGWEKYSFSADRYVATNIAIKPWPKMSGSLTPEQILQLLQSYSIEKEEMEGLKGQLKLIKGEPAITFAVAKTSLSLHAAGKVERFNATGMSVEGMSIAITPDQGATNVTLAIGSYEGNTMDYSGFLRMLVEGGTASGMTGAVTYENLTYHDVRYVLTDLLEVAIKEIVVKDTKFDQGIATNATLSFSGMTLHPGNDTAKKAFSDLEYAEPPVFNGGMAYVYDPAGKRMEMNDFRMNADNVGTLNMSATISGVDIARMNADLIENPDASQRIGQEAIDAMTLHSLKLRYDDKSLVERLYRASAKEDGLDVEDVKQEAVMGVMFLGGMMAEGSEELMSLFTSVSTFLQEPRSLALSMIPAAPLPLGERAAEEFAGKQPSEIIGMLGLSLTANQ